MEELINRIREQARIKREQQHQDVKVSTGHSFKCSKCKDVGFIHIKDNDWKKCSCRIKEETEQRFKNAGVNLEEIKDLEDYEIYNTTTAKAKKCTLDYINEYLDIRKNRKNGFTLLGQAGGGKTFLNLAVAKALINKEINVRYMSYIETIRELKALALNQEEYNKKFSQYVNCDVLIIDDLFKSKIINGQLRAGLTEADLNHIMPILNQRYLNNKPMIISTECRAQQLLELDGATGGRILEASKFTVTFDSGCNYRMKQFGGM